MRKRLKESEALAIRQIVSIHAGEASYLSTTKCHRGEEVTTVSDVVVSSAGMFTLGNSREGKRLRWGRVGGGCNE